MGISLRGGRNDRRSKSYYFKIISPLTRKKVNHLNFSTKQLSHCFLKPYLNACSKNRKLLLFSLCFIPNWMQKEESKDFMKSYRKELWFEVPTRRAFINITPDIEKCLSESGIKEGLVLVNAMHITASVFINDDEPGLHHDYDLWLEKLAPHEPVSQYRHNNGEDNADAHLKRQVMGREVVVAVTKGKLDFGPWEQIFYGEFDGRRRKRVLVKIIGE
jgi:secondary thiamine-phosphate synthase enzyme